MKTITFEGEQYKVENWVNFVARDEDGTVFAFEDKPKIHWGEEWLSDTGRGAILKKGVVNWHESLEEV